MRTVRTHFAQAAVSLKRTSTACGLVVPDARALGYLEASRIVCQACYLAAKAVKQARVDEIVKAVR